MGKQFFGGVPTDIEIRKLREKYTDDMLVEGFEIPYSDVEEIIDSQYRTHRFYTVTCRWRKILEKDIGIILQAISGEFVFRVLKDGEKVTLGTQKVRTGCKMFRRSYNVFAKTDTKKLTEQETGEYNHSVKRITAVLQAAALKPKAQLPEI